MARIGVRQVRAALKRVAKANPDVRDHRHYYWRDWDDNGQPSEPHPYCLVGHILVDLDLPVTTVNPSQGWWFSPLRDLFSPPANDLIERAQTANDLGQRSFAQIAAELV